MAAEGLLVVVATPIGNLGDLSSRAVEAFQKADTVACEDTRRTRALLSHLNIRGKRLVAVHQHNEASQCQAVIEAISNGETVVLVSDAGMPTISDPGERIIAGVVDAGQIVDVIPGPSAVTTALAISGLPAQRFVFEGFLPRKATDRRAVLKSIVADQRTTVIYEAPHRVIATLRELEDRCEATRRVAIARELTKLHQEVFRGTVTSALSHINKSQPRGEYVLVLEGARLLEAPGVAPIEQALRSRLALGETKRSAIAAVAAELGVPKNQVYQLAMKL